MIQIVILVDLDDKSRARSDPPLEAKAPPGYVVNELRCIRWSLDKSGAAELELRLLITGAPASLTQSG